MTSRPSRMLILLGALILVPSIASAQQGAGEEGEGQAPGEQVAAPGPPTEPPSEPPPEPEGEEPSEPPVDPPTGEAEGQPPGTDEPQPHFGATDSIDLTDGAGAHLDEEPTPEPPPRTEPTLGVEHRRDDVPAVGRRCVAPCIPDVAETDPIFTIRRGGLSLGVVGSLNLLGVPFIQDPMASVEAGSIANAEGFRLRRARFGISGQIHDWMDFLLRFQHGEGGANIVDAYGAFDAHRLARISAGALKIPFSRTMMRSSEFQSFLERPYIVRSVAPDRSLGVRVDGRMHWFGYGVGVFNGGGDFYRGDNNEGMLYAARVAVHPLGPLPPGELALPAGFVLEAAGSYYFNQDAAGDRHGAAGELTLQWAGLRVAGEFLWSTFIPGESPVTDEGVEFGHTERMGWFGEASYFIVPCFLQVALRYEGQRVVEATEIRDLNDLWAITAAINAYVLGGRLKLSIQYEHRHEWFNVQEPNDYLAIQLQGRI